MATKTVGLPTAAILTLSSSKATKYQNKNSISFNPNIFTPSNTRIKLFSSYKIGTHQRVILAHKVSNEADDTSEAQPNIPSKEATLDIQLPRRSLLVQFTCNACSERTERYINRIAFERGTVFVQCAGCLKHHKLVDNLGLVTEYNLLEDTNSELND